MKPEWTGRMIGRMHVNGVTYDDLAAEIGVGKAYISMILNGARNPDGMREKLETALEDIIARREGRSDGK